MSVTLDTNWFDQLKARIKCDGGIGGSALASNEMVSYIGLALYDYFACQIPDDFVALGPDYDEDFVKEYDRLKCDGPFNSVDQGLSFIAKIITAAGDACNA